MLNTHTHTHTHTHTNWKRESERRRKHSSDAFQTFQIPTLQLSKTYQCVGVYFKMYSEPCRVAPQF